MSASLEDLRTTLIAITGKPNSLDEKLADYAFFPLSQVLKASKTLSIRCLELCLQCIAIIVREGWRQHIQPQLAAQVVILCTLLAEDHPKGFSFEETTAELQTAAFDCLQCTYAAAGESADCRVVFASETNVPQMGKSISVFLDGLYTSTSAEVQLAATGALQALIEGVADRETRARFLPGIISKLTKILTPSTRQRRNHRVLVRGLQVFSALLESTMGDDLDLDSSKKTPAMGTIIDTSWREKAATQIKPALISILRLREHSRSEVREQLAQLCLMLLTRCRTSMAECAALALETFLSMAGEDSGEPLQVQLATLLRSDHTIADLLQGTVHDWLRSLPTTVQSADEQAKRQKLQQLSVAYGLLIEIDANTGVLDRVMANALRDSITVTLQASPLELGESSMNVPIQSLDLIRRDIKQAPGTEYGPLLAQDRSQETVIEMIEKIAQQVNNSAFVTDLSRSLLPSRSDSRVSNFWLLLTATQSALSRNDPLSDFFDSVDADAIIYQENLELLYDMSLTILASTSDQPSEPRLQSLALRTIALRASTAGQDFRVELIDALYPVLHTLATPNGQLQQDSITTLNILASACEYASVSSLIVENVDYLTNAVALRLNSFDVSPQAPQVLLMMVRLAGPSLLPYLEDTVESIFAVLEGFHGYPLLVELLFNVLGVIAEEGVKAPQLLTIEGPEMESGPAILSEHPHQITVDGLAELLQERKEDEKTLQADAERDDIEPHPRQPWKEPVKDDTSGDRGSNASEDEEEEEPKQQLDEPEIPPPAPKTYATLLKVTDLTQHFLPSASPSLRTSLLGLIRTTVPAIAKHENSFLPLINTLWPEIIARLEDEEAHVRAAALDIVAILCEHAQDFMRTRIMALWPLVMEIHRDTVKSITTASLPATRSARTTTNPSASLVLRKSVLKQAVAHMQASPADYSNTSTRLVWDALVKMLLQLVRSTKLSPDLFDGVVGMLEPVLENAEVREVLEAENADAVWLARLRTGAVKMPTAPRGEGDWVSFEVEHG